MSKEQTTLELNIVEATTDIAQSDVVAIDDLSLALVGGGQYVVLL